MAHMLSPWLKKPNICQNLADESLPQVKSNNVNTSNFRKNRMIRKNEKSGNKKAVVFNGRKGYEFAKNKKTYRRNDRGAVGRRSMQDENQKEVDREVVNRVTDYEKTTATAASRKSKSDSVKVGVRPFSKSRKGRPPVEKRSRRGEKSKKPAGSKIRAVGGKNGELDDEADHEFPRRNKKTRKRNDRGAVAARRSTQDENQNEVDEAVNGVTDYEKTAATAASRKSENNSVEVGVRSFSKTPELDDGEAESASNKIANNEQGVETARTSNPSEPGPLQRERAAVGEDDQGRIQPENIGYAQIFLTIFILSSTLNFRIIFSTSYQGRPGT